MPLFTKNNPGYLNVCVLIAIILAGFALYFLPLQSKFFNYDDSVSIENNVAINKIDLPKIFNAFNTRFLVGLSFALNYRYCVLHPAGYRLINLLIHCLNAFLVYLLVKSTLYLYSACKPMFFCRLEWPAFFAALLFLCHPIATEPVNFITQRFVLMASFFYLLTLFLYIQYRCQSKKRYLIGSLISALAAMFCKEFVVTLPFMLVLYEFYFLESVNETIGTRCRRLIPFFVIVLIVPILLLRTPPEAIGVANIADSYFVQKSNTQKAGNHIDITRAHGSIGRQQYFLTELHVVCTYIRLLFWPFNQNLDYDYPISYHVDKKTALCGVFLLCLLALAGVTYKSYRLVSFGILWFFIALSVESSFIPIGDVITEYRLYLASVGFVILVMSLIYSRPVDQKKLNMIAAIILIGFSIMTYQRNKVWRDDFSLWNDTVGKSPHKARSYNGRGFAYARQGGLTQALSDYNKAIEINPEYAEAYNNRGSTYVKQGNLLQALSDFNKAIAINPDYAGAYYNQGLVCDKQGNYPQALSDYNKAIEINPDYADAYNNRGLVYDKQSNYPQALSDYNKAIEIDPYNSEAYNNRGNIYAKQGDFTLSLSDYNKAITLNPKYADAYYNRGFAWDEKGQLTDAISDYNKAIELAPQYAIAYNNRAVSYYQLKEYDKAWVDARKAESLGYAVNPDFINDLKQASGKDKQEETPQVPYPKKLQ